MRFSIALRSGKTLIGEAGEVHAAAANALLARLAQAAAALTAGEGRDVEIDWSKIRLVAEADTVAASEPDYHHDPNHFIPSLDFTCGIFTAQQKLLAAIQVNGDPPAAASYSRIAETAMYATAVVGVRHPETDQTFTGWQIVSTERGPDDQFGQYRPCEFAAQHPAWLVAMSLPVGWAFRCVGRTIMDCVSPAKATQVVMISVDV